jgi:hypothetical protein
MQRNPAFSGRGHILNLLDQHFLESPAQTPYVLRGMGGIG